MISKSLIFFLLACALASAHPIQGKPAPPSQNVVNIHSWLKLVHDGIKQSYEQVVQPFRKTYKALVEASKNVQQYNQERIEQLRSKFLEIIFNSQEKLNEVENSILLERVIDLQKSVNDLTILFTNIMEQSKQGTNQITQTGHQLGNQNPHSLQNPLHNFYFSKFREGLKEQLKVPSFEPSEGEEFSKVRRGLEDTVGGLNFMNNIPAQFNPFPPQQLPNMNQLEGFTPQQGLESIGNNVNGFLNQAQGALNGGINGIPNNPFSSVINNLPGSLEGTATNINGISQILNNMQKQISQAVSNEINNLRKVLLQWANEVDAFLANGKQIVESQTQTGGFLPGVPLPSSGDRPFNNFGQQVGGSIASGVDKFTNAIGDFFGNAGKLFSG